LAFNVHQINAINHYWVGGGGNDNAKFNQDNWYGNLPTIKSTTAVGVVNKSLLLAKAAKGTMQLLCKLWRLSTKRLDAGTLARLLTALIGTKLLRLLVS
jgi:hypothetical protein